MSGNFSIMQYLFMSFWSVLNSKSLGSPSYTVLYSITYALATNEPNKDQKTIDELEWLYAHTHPDIDITLPQLEMLVFYHMSKGSGLNKELDIDGKGKKVIDLYKYLDQIIQILVSININISKKYSLDIPVQAMHGG